MVPVSPDALRRPLNSNKRKCSFFNLTLHFLLQIIDFQVTFGMETKTPLKTCGSHAHNFWTLSKWSIGLPWIIMDHPKHLFHSRMVLLRVDYPSYQNHLLWKDETIFVFLNGVLCANGTNWKIVIHNANPNTV